MEMLHEVILIPNYFHKLVNDHMYITINDDGKVGLHHIQGPMTSDWTLIVTHTVNTQ